jgi:hypothetical protein
LRACNRTTRASPALHPAGQRARVALSSAPTADPVHPRSRVALVLTAGTAIEMRFQTAQAGCLCSGSGTDGIGPGEGDGAEGSRARRRGPADRCPRAYRARVRCRGVRSPLDPRRQGAQRRHRRQESPGRTACARSYRASKGSASFRACGAPSATLLRPSRAPSNAADRRSRPCEVSSGWISCPFVATGQPWGHNPIAIHGLTDGNPVPTVSAFCIGEGGSRWLN